MSVSKVKLCNLALAKIKVQSIISMTEDSEQARLCNLVFDSVLDELLQMRAWNFATERASLARLSTTPNHEYLYEYALPTDPYCLQVLEVYNDYEYRIEGRKLLTNEESIDIKYIKRITDYNELTALFISVLTSRLAYELCINLTGSTSYKSNLEGEFAFKYRKAVLADSMEQNPRLSTSSTWLNARL